MVGYNGLLFDCVQEYKTHSDESDPVRIQQIIDRAMSDAQWVTKKVSGLCYRSLLFIGGRCALHRLNCIPALKHLLSGNGPHLHGWTVCPHLH